MNKYMDDDEVEKTSAAHCGLANTADTMKYVFVKKFNAVTDRAGVLY